MCVCNVYKYMKITQPSATMEKKKTAAAVETMRNRQMFVFVLSLYFILLRALAYTHAIIFATTSVIHFTIALVRNRLVFPRVHTLRASVAAIYTRTLTE